MGDFFHGWRKIGVVTFAMVFVLVAACSKPKPERDLIDTEATEAIDFKKLDKPLSEFIELVRYHSVIDQPASKFKSVLNEASRRPSSGSSDNTEEFSFVLPTTPESLNRLKELYQVDSQPMLWVVVNKANGKILKVRLYIQTL